MVHLTLVMVRVHSGAGRGREDALEDLGADDAGKDFRHFLGLVRGLVISEILLVVERLRAERASEGHFGVLKQ